MFGLWEFNLGASPSEGVVVQGCDRAWRVECIMELKKNAGSPILDNARIMKLPLHNSMRAINLFLEGLLSFGIQSWLFATKMLKYN